MELLVLILGFVLGFLVACIGIRKLLIGTLKFACEKDAPPYLFLELSDPDVMKIAKKRYVVLKVNPDVVFSQK